VGGAGNCRPPLQYTLSNGQLRLIIQVCCLQDLLSVHQTDPAVECLLRQVINAKKLEEIKDDTSSLEITCIRFSPQLQEKSLHSVDRLLFPAN
jgi:hypothetical protein